MMKNNRKYQWLNECLTNCGCGEKMGLWTGKRNFSINSYSRPICGTCNKGIVSSKSNYIKLPKPMNGLEIFKWLKTNKKKYLLGKVKVKKLKKNQITWTTMQQIDIATRKAQVPKIKEMFKTKKGYTILYYGEVLVFKKILKPSNDKEVIIAFTQKSIKLQTNKITMILGMRKSNVPSVEEYVKSEMKNPSKKSLFGVYI